MLGKSWDKESVFIAAFNHGQICLKQELPWLKVECKWMSTPSCCRIFLVIPSVVKIAHLRTILVQEFVKFIGIILNIIFIKACTLSICSNKFVAQKQAYIYSLLCLSDVTIKTSPVPVLVLYVISNGFPCAILFV